MVQPREKKKSEVNALSKIKPCIPMSQPFLCPRSIGQPILDDEEAVTPVPEKQKGMPKQLKKCRRVSET